MKILIIGAGSLGLLLAGRLAAAGGARVRLVARTAEQAAQIAEQGVDVRDSGGTIHATGVHCVSFSEEASSEEASAA